MEYFEHSPTGKEMRSLDELRQEAIKWIKHIQSLSKEDNSKFYRHAGFCNALRLFFNISNKELNSDNSTELNEMSEIDNWVKRSKEEHPFVKAWKDKIKRDFEELNKKLKSKE